MIGRLLGAVPVTAWLMLASLAFAGWQWWQADRYQAEAAQVSKELQQSEARGAALSRALEWQRDQIRSLSSALAARDERLADDKTEINQRRDTARQLERADDATADWADQPVPAATRQWLRNLASDTGAGNPDPDSAELPADAATGTQPPGEP